MNRTTLNQPSPLISVIVPFYNVESYARKCIESIQAQTYKNLEIILVDDGSPDRCGEICDEYAARDPRIKVIHKKNGGLSSARNSALEIATGKYIGFVDSDDWIEPQMYEKMLQGIISSGSEIAICGVHYDYKNCTTQNKHFPANDLHTYSRDAAIKILIEDKGIHNYVCDKLFSKDVIKTAFPIGVTLEDIRTTIRWFANAKQICTVPFNGYHYIQRKGSILHGDNIVYRIHYIESLISQLDFLKTNNLLKDHWAEYERRIIMNAIREARDISRTRKLDAELYSGFSKIVNLISPYIPGEINNIPSKYQTRYKLLANRPKLFYYWMKASYSVQFSRRAKKSTKEYYA